MAGLFENYRTAHHPDAEIRLRLAKAQLRGELDPAHAVRILRKRDRVLWLEMESSTLAGILIEPLLDACPAKRFIVTVRDVYSWCDSWLDHNINGPPSDTSPWRELDRVRLRADAFPPTVHDAPLTERGFPSLAAFFQLWANHHTHVLGAIPPERLLVVKTHDIGERVAEIAEWVDVPEETLRADRAWLFASPIKHRVLAALDPSYVQETADRFCADLMRQYFPEVVVATRVAS